MAIFEAKIDKQITVEQPENVELFIAEGKLSLARNGKIHDAILTSVSFEQAVYIALPEGNRIYPLRGFSKKSQDAAENYRKNLQDYQLPRRFAFTE